MWEIWKPYVIGMALGFLLAILLYEIVAVIKDYINNRKG